MYMLIINHILSNPMDIIVPLGVVLRYAGEIVALSVARMFGSKQEDPLTKTYAHMTELQLRGDEAVDQRTEVMIENALLKKENRDLKKHLRQLEMNPKKIDDSEE